MGSRLIMYSMLNKKIEGLVAAPFTPFDEQGELNLEIIPSYYSSLKKNNVAGAFICGSTGEGVSLTDRKSTRLNSSHVKISYAVFCLKKKNSPLRNLGYAV